MNTDLVNRLIVTAAAVCCAVGTLVGTGVIGTRVEESSGGALAADATLIAPAGPAFSIWSVIYLGLAAYVVWQWLPAQSGSARARAIAWWAGASMLLNAGWLLVTQQGWLWISVLVIVALAVVLMVIMARLGEHPPRGWGDRIAVDVTFGLYLGWVAVAVCANVAATLVDAGAPATGTGPEVLTVALLAGVLALALFYLRRFRAGRRIRWPVAVAMAWGVGWIAYGRLGDQPASTLVGLSAAAVCAGILAAAALLSLRTVVPARGT